MVAMAVEQEAVRSFLRDIRELVHPSGTVYEQGFFEADGSVWQVALGQTGMGNVVAAIETSRALDSFRPDLAMFVGVAGGLNGLEVGDVVAADYVYGYETGRYAETHQSRIKTFGSGYPLVQRAHAVRRHEHWHKRISSEAKPRSFVGPIASGELIIAGEKTPAHEILEANCGDAYAVEMEGWGFLFAAHTNGDVPAIVIRGISDLTIDRDLLTDLRTQPVAAEHAAAFAFELIATLESAGADRLKVARPWRPKLRKA
jgi:nucleoside phosphorylase